jgi:hypothetical protein
VTIITPAGPAIPTGAFSNCGGTFAWTGAAPADDELL